LAQLQGKTLDHESIMILCAMGNLSTSDYEQGREALDAAVRKEDEAVDRFGREIDRYGEDLLTKALLAQISQKEVGPRVSEFPKLQLMLNGMKYLVNIPKEEGAWALYETLIQAPYEHVPASPVTDIYDLGSFIGLTSLYLHSLYPGAMLTCVEPSSINRSILSTNLSANCTEYRVVPNAVAGKTCEISLMMSRRPSMLNSAYADMIRGDTESVEAKPLSDIICSTSYGIKLDIEGSEFDLRSAAHLIIGANWVLGELHYGYFSTPSHRWLLDLLRNHFVVSFGLPRVDKYGEQYVIAQTFQAFARH
jgi:FkbM family methyltransferase